MDPLLRGAIIYGKFIPAGKIPDFCRQRLSNGGLPLWEEKILHFILDFLDLSEHIILESSGTTGLPKKIHLLKSAMIRSALQTAEKFRLRENQTALLCLPVDYIAGKMMVVRSIVCGMNLLATEPKSVLDINDCPSIDFCAMVPLQVLNLLICRRDLYPIKKLLIGGADISHELEKLVQSITTEVYASYGMAETCSHVALRRLNGGRPQKYYNALPDINLSPDDRGCLVIEAPYLPQRVVTNDMVEFTTPGSFKWLGRYDNLINSGGLKIVPELVESMIMEKTRLECVAIGAPDRKLGQKLILVIEKDQASLPPETLKSELAHILPGGWKPREILFINKFPRNDSLKIDRRKLSEMIL